jgi:nanoRNase/pAp phosphatase (c-di-AMP/oligoRNAs hydrolase)
MEKYRLITRSDFDGLVCAILLRDLDMIDDILFVHPKDMQDGKIDVTGHDITTNLPYVAAAGLAFDHHASELVRNGGDHSNYIIDADAPSAARVVYDHFGGSAAFPTISKEMMSAVDKADSAQFTLDEVVEPQGWVLLSFLMDARTGLGRFRNFRVSNYELMMQLIEYCAQAHDPADILALPDVKERVDVYDEHAEGFIDQLRRCVEVRGDVAIIDLRGEDIIHAGNRMLIYAIFPQCNVSIHVLWGRQKLNTVLAVGKSIFDRTNEVDVGELMLAYGGGGHHAAGTCQVPHDQADTVLNDVANRLNGQTPLVAALGH